MPYRIALAGGVLKYFSRYRLGTCLKSGMMKLNTPPQREEFTSNILCKLVLSFGSTANAKRRGRTLTVALFIEVFLNCCLSYLTKASDTDILFGFRERHA